MEIFSDEIPVCGVQYVGLLHPFVTMTNYVGCWQMRNILFMTRLLFINDAKLNSFYFARRVLTLNYQSGIVNIFRRKA
jgi:hypothetical protein